MITIPDADMYAIGLSGPARRTSPGSALAIDRFSSAPDGVIDYQRGSIKTSRAVAKAVADGKAVVVIHGVDDNNDGT